MIKTNHTIDIKDYSMPAEWELHERTFLEWPVQDSLIWPDNYEKVCRTYAAVAKAIASCEPVTLIVNEDTLAEAKSYCCDSVTYQCIPHNDAWCRDNGPTFLRSKEGQRAGVNWKFNAWGEKYLPYDLDDKVARIILTTHNIPIFDAPLVLEGGSIHVDGCATLLTTKECLLNKNRNASLSQEEIESYLKDYLSVSNIIWLEHGLFGDETDGHIDNAACFVAPHTVMIQSCYDKDDPNYAIFMENKKILEQAYDASGAKLEIIEIPAPPARYYKGERLTLSYLNFYFVNGGIILPVFGEDAASSDKKAEEILQKTFPERKIISVNTIDLITEGGNIHCITQQMPQGSEESYENGNRCSDTDELYQ